MRKPGYIDESRYPKTENYPARLFYELPEIATHYENGNWDARCFQIYKQKGFCKAEFVKFYADGTSQTVIRTITPLEFMKAKELLRNLYTADYDKAGAEALAIDDFCCGIA